MNTTSPDLRQEEDTAGQIRELTLSRRSSSSSEHTIDNVSANLPHSDKPYTACTQTVLKALKQAPGSHESDQASFATFSNMRDLQLRSKHCQMCRLLWRILRSTGLEDRVTKYSNDDFNSTGLYLPDGGTDIEELVNPGPRVKLTASIYIEWAGCGQGIEDLQTVDKRSWCGKALDAKAFDDQNMWSSDLFQLSDDEDTLDPGSDLDDRDMLQDLNIEDTGINCIVGKGYRYQDHQEANLQLLFEVSYKGQVRSQERVKEDASEGLVIYLETGCDELPIEHGYLSFTPPDLRPTADDKWRLLGSWVLPRASDHETKAIPGWDQPRPSWLPARSVPTSIRPRRYLDLSHDGQIFLLDDPEGNIKTSYVALSHRWGSSQHLIATKAGLDQLTSGIPVELLPQTFKDAVTVARRLEVYMLWIDALCVVQDDEIDWQREAAKMGDIYRNARFVIAAHCAEDDSDGFLASSMLMKRDMVRFELPGTKDSVCIHRRSQSDDIATSRLSKRGWVLQERLMAMHTLHFTKNGVFSETPSTVLSEDGPIDPETLSRITSASFEPTVVRPTWPLYFDKPGQETPRLWHTLIETYTRCDLSREEDKLVAISGIASKIAKSTGVHWCAGLWGDRLSFGLSWLPAQTLDQLANAQAPSWSWAAWDGAVQYPEWYEAEKQADFISLHTVGVESSVVAWLQGPGIVRVSARLIPLDNVIVSNKAAQLGPGPDRRGYLTTDDKDLPRLRLKHFVLAHTLRGRRFATKRLRVHEDQLPPCGWLAFDDQNYLQEIAAKFDTAAGLRGCYFVMLSIDRVPSGGLVYTRIGCGQLSHSFMSGKDLKYEAWRTDELSWSEQVDDTYFLVPNNLPEHSEVATE